MAVVAADRAGEKLAQTFEAIANEVCDRHIETFRSIHDLARLYLDELAEDTMMLIQRNSLIREQSEEFLDRGEVPPANLKTMSVSGNANALLVIAQTVRLATIEGERLILGLREYRRLNNGANDGDHHISEICRILTRARKEYGMSKYTPELEGPREESPLSLTNVH